MLTEDHKNTPSDVAEEPSDNAAHAPASHAEEKQYAYASFDARLLATILDSVFSLVPLLLVAPFIHYFGNRPPESSTAWFQDFIHSQNATDAYKAAMLEHFDRIYFALINFSSQMLVFGVLVVMLWIYFAGTPGKLLLGMRVLDEKTGEAPKPLQAVIRYIGYFVSVAPVMLGFFWVAFTKINKRRRGWHDMLAGTVVVYTENSIYQRVVTKCAKWLSGRRD